MNFSLNEVEALAKRAAFGAGYPWGIAEETAKAVRWLCSNSMDGCESLAELLSSRLADDLSEHVPDQLEGEWYGRKELCPISTGSILSDNTNLVSQAPIEIANLRQPMLMLPFASYLSGKLGGSITVVGKSKVDFQAIVNDSGLELTGEIQNFAANLVVSEGGKISNPRNKSQRAVVCPQSWKNLDQFAKMTYAPATDESRLRGAGSDMTGN